VTKNTTLTPDKIGKIEDALEERKTKRDRRNKVDPQAAPKSDRRTGRDRRDPS
jgi:hypothetical protein